MTYINQRYGFRLSVPKWWKGRVFLTHDKTLKEAEYAVQFHLRYRQKLQGKGSTIIFNLLVFRMSPAQWKTCYKDSPLEFIAYHDGRVLAYLTPSEPPEEFLLPDLSDYDRSLLEFRWLKRMINIELPCVVRSFRLLRNRRCCCA